MPTTTNTAPTQTPPTATTVVERPVYTEPEPLSDEQVAAKGQVARITTMPALLPPGTAGAESALTAARAAAVGATWRFGVTVTAMWSINETRNAWMYVQSLGWRKLFNGRDGAFNALVMLAAQARQTGRPISLREEADGMVYEIYLW